MTCNASEFIIKNGVLLKCREQKETIIVPDGVTQIGDYVFEDFFDTKQIILPDGLIKIGCDAFYRCKSLKSITIPTSVTKIECRAFKNSGIEHITLPPGLREISDELFQYSEIREITIPEGVRKIGSDAFESCRNLEKVALPESLKEIWGCAFASCERLKQINLPETTAVWGNAFGMCEALADENGFIILNKALYESPAMYKTETVEVPDGVEVLNQATPTANSSIRYFDANRKLIHNFCTKLVIPESVKKYGPRAFYWGKLKTIISRSPANLGPLAFHSCESLQNITVRHDVEISKNLFSYNQQDNEKAMQRLRITYTDSTGKSLTYAKPTENAEIPNIAKGEKIMEYKNYESINPTPNATAQNWCISLGKMSPKQLSVTLAGGKSYAYASRFKASPQDTVIIGNEYVFWAGATNDCGATTGMFGTVSNINDKFTAKKDYLLELDMVFSPQPDKRQISACEKYLALPADATNLQYDKGTQNIYPITFMTRKILAAASILAHPNLASGAALTAAAEYLNVNQHISDEAKSLGYVVSEYTDIPLWDIYVPNPDRCASELAGTPLFRWDKFNRFAENWKKDMEIPEKIQQYVHKYVHIGAISIMIRGGFKNLLEAYLGVNPPISAFYEDALADIGTHGYAELMQIFKNHFSSSKKSVSSAGTQPAPAQDKPIAKSAEPVKSSAAPATEAASFTGCIGDFKIRNNKLSKYTGSDKHVTIPDGITYISKDAFSSCTSLTSVTLPDGVTTIGESAFSHCRNLRSVVIPNTVKKISGWAFKGCTALADITIPDSVTSIDLCAFEDCTSLRSIVIPRGVKEIVYQAFKGCTSLGSIVIPQGVKRIAYQAFGGCTALTDITIPDSVTSIGDSAFEGCTALTSISIPNGVTSIYETAFKGCTNLRSIVIPTRVTSIHESAFEGCHHLTIHGAADCYAARYAAAHRIPFVNEEVRRELDEQERIKAAPGTNPISDFKIRNNKLSKYLGTAKEVTIPDGVTFISKEAFWGCSSLISVTIPDGVTTIGDSAFRHCWNLRNVVIPNSVKRISYSAFKGCTALADITIPDSVKEIELCAFEDCSSLSSITIPDSVKISAFVFRGCTKLANSNGFVVIKDALYEYFGSENNVLIPEGVKKIGPYAFHECTSLSSIIIPDSVKRISDWAFKGCTALADITIPDSVKEISYSAFSGCSSLSSIIIPGSVKEIAHDVFSNCSSISSIIIPDSVKKISDRAFKGCTSLTSISIPDSVKEIGNSAFEGCSHLTIYGPAGCYAEEYAAEQGIPFMDEETRRKVEEEARRKAEEEARRKAEEEARRKAEEEARRKAEEEARRKAEEEARRKAEEEARRRAEEEARRKVEARKNEIYEQAKRLMMSKNPTSIREAANKFFTISGWRDADELKAKCPERAEKAKIYQNACDKMNGVHIGGSGKVINEEPYRSAIKIFETIKDWEDSEEQIRCCLEKIKAQQIARQTDLIAQKSKLGLFAGKQKKEIQAQIDALQTEIDAVNEAINRLKK